MDLRPKTDLRYEIKFLVNWEQQQALLADLRPHLVPDAHGDGGQYLVTSLYYDTPDYKAYWDKMDGFDFRRKVRLRAYGAQPILPETMIFAEIKARVGNRMGKRRVRCTYAEAMALTGPADLATPPLPVAEKVPEKMAEKVPEKGADQSVADELHYLFAALRLQPTAVVSYQRLALGGHIDYPDLRVTFDTVVRGRSNNLSLLTVDDGTAHTILDPGWSILEVKVNQTMPFWLGELLSRHRCTPRRISKYCAVLERCGLIAHRQQILLPSED